MAETYGIFDLEAVPLQTAAVLAQGLRADSRIMSRLIMENKDKQSAGFETPEAFMAARAKLMEVHNGD